MIQTSSQAYSFATLARTHLLKCQHDGRLLISPVVYAELLARPNISDTFLGGFLHETGIQVNYQLDQSVWTQAGMRFARHAHRRRAELRAGPRRILADFIIGAHALAHADRLMTFDTTIYQQDFPELPLYTAHIN